MKDSINLHRRDYNAEAQILPGGHEAITMFSGVFQHNVDLPYLNSVLVDDSGYKVNNNFKQFYNHYHCAAIPLFSESSKNMHTLFFGGIAQYYDKNGTLTQDNNVPFVNTIARVTRDSTGVMSEYKLPTEMPTLLGAGAEFIPNKNLSHYSNEVLKFDALNHNDLLGYIYGGISSTAANIFFNNGANLSEASNQIFEIRLVLNDSTSHILNTNSISGLHAVVYPNPSKKRIAIRYTLTEPSDVAITIMDLSGKVVKSFLLKNQSLGEHNLEKRLTNDFNSGIYLVSISTNTEKITRRIVVEN
jgi:hypothetical protein